MDKCLVCTKKTRAAMKYKPRDLQENVKSEPWSNKACLAGLGVVMFGVSSAYGFMFFDVTRRSVQYQELAMSGQLEFNTFSNDPRDIFALQNQLDVYREKSTRDLKYIDKHWHSQRINNINWGPQGDTTEANKWWFVQTARLEDEEQSRTEDNRQDPGDAQVDTNGDLNLSVSQARIDRDAKSWDDWADWYKDMLWFDTVGCWSSSGRSMIGQVTNAEFYPLRYSWKTTGPEDEKDDNDEYWGVFLETRGGSIDWHDTSMAEKVLQNSIDIMKDCDWDCQKFGSGLTLVALLNYIAYLIIWINSIIFFTGSWRWVERVTSVYCAHVACVIQFVMLIISGAILFRPYAAQCGFSMVETYGSGMDWYMSDDYMMVVGLWSSSWVWMFVFLSFAACCGTRRIEKQY